MFLVFSLLTGLKAVVANAIIWSIAGALWAILTRRLIIRRDRRAGRLPRPKQ